MNAPRSGLGRGLAALIPTAESAEHADLSAGDQLFYNLVQGGLDQIDTHTKCDLLAYVHQPHNDEPSLFLRRPGRPAPAPTTRPKQWSARSWPRRGAPSNFVRPARLRSTERARCSWY